MGNSSIIKAIIIIIIFNLFFSCIEKNKLNAKNSDCYYIFKKEKYSNLIFLSGKKNKDTLLFVTRNKKNQNCIAINNDMNQIDHISELNEIIFFEYNLKVVGKSSIAKTGAFKPGTKAKIVNSYKQRAYFIK